MLDVILEELQSNFLTAGGSIGQILSIVGECRERVCVWVCVCVTNNI